MYVFREDLTWTPLHEIWRVPGAPHPGDPEIIPLEPAPRFDGRIALRGGRIDEEKGELILVWEALAPPGRRWQVFVHLLDAKGQLLGQADGPMAEGLAPTEAWQAGDQVIDRHQLPRGLTPSALRIGLYDLTTGERAAVTWQGSAPPDRSVVLPISR